MRADGLPPPRATGSARRADGLPPPRATARRPDGLPGCQPPSTPRVPAPEERRGRMWRYKGTYCVHQYVSTVLVFRGLFLHKGARRAFRRRVPRLCSCCCGGAHAQAKPSPAPTNYSPLAPDSSTHSFCMQDHQTCAARSRMRMRTAPESALDSRLHRITGLAFPTESALAPWKRQCMRSRRPLRLRLGARLGLLLGAQVGATAALLLTAVCGARMHPSIAPATRIQ